MSASTVSQPAAAAVVDEQAVIQVCGIWSSLKLAIEQKTRIIVEMLYVADSITRGAMVAAMIEDGLKPGWAHRMEACAIKGVVNAVHLYRAHQVVCSRSIIAATVKHARKIANPIYDFSWVSDDNNVVHIRAQNLTYHQALDVWDPINGVTSVADQRKRRKAKFDAAAAKPTPVYRVLKAVSKTDGNRRKLIELHICPEGDTVVSDVKTFPVSELRKFIK